MRRKYIVFLIIGVFVLGLVLLIRWKGCCQSRLVEKYTPNEYIRGIIEELRVLNPQLFDRLRIYPADESYTLDKSVIYLCIHDPETGDYYPQNYLKYVIMHEASHVLCDEIDHTAKFNQIFSGFIKRAVELGIYDDTVPLLRKYCGKHY